MKTMTFYVPIYDIDVMLVQIEGKADAEEIAKPAQWIKLEKNELEELKNAISRGCFNGGDTWRNLEIRKFMIDFLTFSTKDKKTEVYNHEKRHLEDRILEHACVNDIEASAMLAGFLGVKFDKFYKMTEKK